MKHNYGKFDFFVTVFSLGMYYIADWASDGSTIAALFRSGHIDEATITIASILFATYSLNALQAYWDKRDYGRTCLARIFYILPLGLLYQRYRCMALLLPIVFYPNYVKEYESDMQQQLLLEDWKSIKLALIQTTIPNFVHVVWNFQPIFVEAHRARDLQRAGSITVVISFLVCVLGLCDYHHHRHIVLRTLKEIKTYQGIIFRILNFLSTSLMLGARLVAVTAALSNSVLVLPFLIAIAGHYCASWVIIVWKDWDAFLKHEIPKKENVEKGRSETDCAFQVSELETKCCNWFGKFILSLILLGTPIYESLKYPVTAVYLLENIGLIVAWYLTSTSEGLWNLKILITVVVGNVLGIALCFLKWKLYLKQGSAKPHVFLIAPAKGATEMVPFSREQVPEVKPTKTHPPEAAMPVVSTNGDKKDKAKSDSGISDA